MKIPLKVILPLVGVVTDQEQISWLVTIPTKSITKSKKIKLPSMLISYDKQGINLKAHCTSSTNWRTSA